VPTWEITELNGRGWRRVLATMRHDLAAVAERDPAARSRLEVALCYPGVWAVWGHRVSNRLWHGGWPLPARFVSQATRFLTGIEIHPAATVGPGLFIDHGMGVVIGETAEVGADVTLYQGVTLGGTSLHHGKRHPTIGDGVVIGAGAKILGSFTVGERSRIGANAVVVKPVPPDAVVIGVPGRIVAGREGGSGAAGLENADLPDVVGQTLLALIARVEQLEERVEGASAASGPFVADAQGIWHQAPDFQI
jgi:serine O-acetyltransferase